MKVHVKLFGPFSLMSGRNEFEIQAVGESISVENFIPLLGTKLPHLKRSIKDIDADLFLKQRVLLVINGMPCSDKMQFIHDGDHIKVLTPVTGG